MAKRIGIFVFVERKCGHERSRTGSYEIEELERVGGRKLCWKEEGGRSWEEKKNVRKNGGLLIRENRGPDSSGEIAIFCGRVD